MLEMTQNEAANPNPITSIFKLNNMKNLLLALVLLSGNGAFAQNGKFVSAWNYKESYKKGDGVQNLEDAKRVIDEAIADPVGATMIKGWWYRSEIINWWLPRLL